MVTTPERSVSPGPAELPLLNGIDSARVLAWRDGLPVSVAQFVAHVQQVAVRLPAAATVNLCEDRYAFLVAFCAIALRGQINLLPPSRAPRAIDEVMAAHPGCYALGEQALQPAPLGYLQLPDLDVQTSFHEMPMPTIPAAQTVAIAYTSGSTGVPKANAKSWRNFHASNAGNLRMLQRHVASAFAIVATVPPQHIFGLETSVLLPLLGTCSVHTGRPFFPAEVVAALAQVPAPRVLVTTPVHLRALLAAQLPLPPLAAVLSATAPLTHELAVQAQAQFACEVLEVFGSTETCAFASRRSACEEDWQLYDAVSLQPRPDGTLIEAPQLDAPAELADIVSLHDGGRRFRLHGRHADLLEIAGKRASLNDLSRRLLAIPGVRDGVVFQLDEADAGGVRRIAAVVVAPEVSEMQILDALRPAMDPVFLPRRLIRVEALPRNETGKLPRAALLALIGGASPR
ncbi:MAG: AMP-binding protein [Dyella sp.]